jgi:hypothetical protein
MTLTAAEVNKIVCPWCFEYGRDTILRARYPRKNWLVGRCDFHQYDWAEHKLTRILNLSPSP